MKRGEELQVGNRTTNPSICVFSSFYFLLFNFFFLLAGEPADRPIETTYLRTRDFCWKGKEGVAAYYRTPEENARARAFPSH